MCFTLSDYWRNMLLKYYSMELKLFVAIVTIFRYNLIQVVQKRDKKFLRRCDPHLSKQPFIFGNFPNDGPRSFIFVWINRLYNLSLEDGSAPSVMWCCWDSTLFSLSNSFSDHCMLQKGTTQFHLFFPLKIGLVHSIKCKLFQLIFWSVRWRKISSPRN